MRVLRLRINGDDLRVAAPDHWSLLEVLRYELGLTGSKQGCDKGDCGACTVLVDGKPVLACLTLAGTVEGRAVTTIEGLAPAHVRAGGQGADPVQEAFDRCGALQCGFCQPGMILSARALLNENACPTREEIRHALSGNLCRCTGYTQILEAVELAVAESLGVEPAPRSWEAQSMKPEEAQRRARGGRGARRRTLEREARERRGARRPRRPGRGRARRRRRTLVAARDRHGPGAPWGDARAGEIENRDFSVVGKPLRKVDGLAKATGAAVYADDIQLPGMLHAKTLRSTHAHARIVSIDASAALALPGVHAVITGRDLPVCYGVIPWTPDENALAVDKVRFIGDEVAAVAAIDEDTANAALKLIEVEYEPLRAFLDPFEALATPEPQIHPPPDGDPKKRKKGNVSKHVALSFGEVDRAFEEADVVLEGEYFFHGTTHTPIEPHCAVAQVSPDGLLTLWSSTQITHYVHRALASVLEMDPARIRVVQPCLGGAFGGKSDPFSLEFCVSLLAMRTGRPVKMLWTREEVFYAHRGRHPMHMRYRTAAKRDGRITGVDAKILIDGGSYSSFGLVTTYYSGQLLTGPYDFPSYRFDSTRVFTNKPPCGPKRGHGSVQPRFAFEVQLDELAERLAIDPIELRRKNFQGESTETVNGQRITSNGFQTCLDEVERASGWRERRGKLPYGRGLGVAGSMYISGTNYPVYPNPMPQAGIQLKVDRSGVVTVFTGGNDIGQGSNSMVAYVVAEELGVPVEHVRVVAADTDLCPVDLGAYSSRVTFMVGNATIDACRKLRAQIVAALAEAWEVEPDRVRLIEGRAIDLADAARSISTAEAFQIAEARFDTLGATGSYNTPELGGDYRGGTIGASPAYSFTAHVVEVDVDVETGRITVERCFIAHDCGRALNPMLVAGQMEGSAYMGLAEAVLEHHDVNRFGLHQGPSLLDYRIPTAVDTPELHALIVESLDPEGPYGAKEAGEGPLHPSIPAISNAVFDAVGIRLRHLPFTPGKVLAALAAKDAPGKPAAPARGAATRGGKA